MRDRGLFLKRMGFAVVVGIVAAVPLLPGRARAQEGNAVESSSAATEHDKVSLDANHHYQSPADRANDALLITEVKSALDDDGVAAGSPIIVDCDHGKILLIGVMRSAGDAKRADTIAAQQPGVITVKNQLTWH